MIASAHTLFRRWTVDIPPHDQETVERALYYANLVRIRSFCWLLVGFNLFTTLLILILAPQIANIANNDRTTTLLLLTRAVLLATAVSFLFISRKAARREPSNQLQGLGLGVLLILLTALAVHAGVFQGLRPLIAPYLIAIFAVAAFTYLPAGTGLSVFLVSFAAFLGCQFLFQPDAVLLVSNIIHGLGMAIVAFVASRVTYNFKVREILAQRRIELLSLTDQLTGLPNRRAMEDRLDKEWSRCERQGLDLGLLMVDVDHFKRYNDLHGHQAGDECLRQTALALAGQAHRGGDLAARYGGEEFLVLLPDTDLAGTLLIAERIRQAVENLAIPAAPGETLTVSLGAACVRPGPGESLEGLCRAADQALYQAKAEGRNRVVGTEVEEKQCLRRLGGMIPPRPPR